jgi:hypothetical protein
MLRKIDHILRNQNPVNLPGIEINSLYKEISILKKLFKNEIYVHHIAFGEDTNRGGLP